MPTTNRFLLIAMIALPLGLAAPAHAAGDAAAGKTAAAGCAMCHGANGEGNRMGPKLAGEDPGKFIQAMNDYKTGKRDNAVMKMQASKYGADDISNMAAFYAGLH
jgi:cytochrome c553